MWEYDCETGTWAYTNDNEYVMVTTGGGTRGAWTEISSWVDGGAAWTEVGYRSDLDDFEPKPRCIFDK